MGPITYTKPDHLIGSKLLTSRGFRIPTSSYPHRKLYNMKMENKPFENLGGGFKYFLFSPLPREMIQF